jgi:hypothetical protein
MVAHRIRSQLTLPSSEYVIEEVRTTKNSMLTESQRLNVEHVALQRLIGANYVGPVAWILQAEPARPHRLVVDIGHGTGKW